MKCSEFEQWISDFTDGKLPKTKRIILEEHFLCCPSCRVYKKNTDAIHEEVSQLDQSGPEPEYFRDFTERLQARLVSESQPKRSAIFVDLGWRWAYTAAAAAFVAVMMFFFISPSHRFFDEGGAVVTSYEDAIREINESIGNDVQLEELFNTILLASIAKEVEDPNWRDVVDYCDDDNFLKDLTEEEMKLLNTIKKKKQG